MSVEQIAARIPDQIPTGRRFVVALGGPPAAGKSTLAESLAQELGPRAVVLGLDAFHFDDAVLIARGDRERKGAPHTFDVVSYRHLLGLLRNSRHDELAVPVFDRSMELSRNCAAVVAPANDVVITEGNYLLTDVAPWADLRESFDLTVGVTASEEVIEERILARWLSHDLSIDEAQTRAAVNDLPNARWVLSHSVEPDISVISG